MKFSVRWWWFVVGNEVLASCQGITRLASKRVCAD
jgi:hypothetical protein